MWLRTLDERGKLGTVVRVPAVLYHSKLLGMPSTYAKFSSNEVLGVCIGDPWASYLTKDSIFPMHLPILPSLLLAYKHQGLCKMSRCLIIESQATYLRHFGSHSLGLEYQTLARTISQGKKAHHIWKKNNTFWSGRPHLRVGFQLCQLPFVHSHMRLKYIWVQYSNTFWTEWWIYGIKRLQWIWTLARTLALVSPFTSKPRAMCWCFLVGHIIWCWGELNSSWRVTSPENKLVDA